MLRRLHLDRIKPAAKARGCHSYPYASVVRRLSAGTWKLHGKRPRRVARKAGNSSVVGPNHAEANMTIASGIAIKVADEVWIAAALLHREHSDEPDFAIEEIM